MYKTVFVNQCGYLPEMKKQATFVSDRPVRFSVMKSDGSCVCSAVAAAHFDNASSKETVYVGDFSEVTTPGRYYILSENHSESDTFTIGREVYNDVLQKAVKFFYLQRCGCDLPASKAGSYAHRACHTAPAIIYESPEQKEVSGGWHDAGDYGRYIVPAAMAAAQLLLAYEADPSFIGQYSNPLGSVLPDCLEEIKYELDWMLKLQREDGQVYHKATCRSFCGFIMPEEETAALVLSPVSVTATADFAAVMAMAVRFYKPYDPQYASLLAAAAKKAYASLSGMSLPGGFINPSDISTGEYGDPCDTDELYWAAAELYKAFGDERYHEDFKALAKEKVWHGYGWEDMGSYGNLAYLSASRPTDERLKESIRLSMTALAAEKLSLAEHDGYSTALAPDGYIWGSNLYAAINGLHLYDAFRLTGERRYLEAAASQLHYLLGRNPMGLCYMTGCGTSPVVHPHHRPSGFLGKAMPGMLSGGPCSWLADEAAKGVLTVNTAPAKMLVDMTGSYSTNEVTIYWNSAFILLLALIHREL